MAQYKNEGIPEDYDVIVFLCYQLRFYTKSFEKFHSPLDAQEISKYQDLIDTWLSQNVKKISQ